MTAVVAVQVIIATSRLSSVPPAFSMGCMSLEELTHRQAVVQGAGMRPPLDWVIARLGGGRTLTPYPHEYNRTDTYPLRGACKHGYPPWHHQGDLSGVLTPEDVTHQSHRSGTAGQLRLVLSPSHGDAAQWMAVTSTKAPTGQPPSSPLSYLLGIRYRASPHPSPHHLSLKPPLRNHPAEAANAQTILRDDG